MIFEFRQARRTPEHFLGYLPPAGELPEYPATICGQVAAWLAWPSAPLAPAPV